MITQILDGLSKILGPIAPLSKDRQELEDSALKAISTALNETYLFYRDMEHGSQRNLEREAQLVKYWSAAAIPMRHFDEDLSNVCDQKSEYWVMAKHLLRQIILEAISVIEIIYRIYQLNKLKTKLQRFQAAFLVC